MVDSAQANGTEQRDIRSLARKARAASRKLQSLNPTIRTTILQKFSDALNEPNNVQQILSANKKDTDAVANDDKMSSSMKARLVLNEKKLKVCSEGALQLAKDYDPIGKVVRRTQLGDNTELQQITVPLGVLLIIFEARPEVLPQLCALAIKSGNALLLKGGKETTNSLNILYDIAVKCINEGSNNEINGNELVVLLSGRSEVDALLSCDDSIDLVIPRGSNSLVTYIQNHTKIPVMGHAEGICHVYVDKDADVQKAINLVVDSKTDYPAACNAMETLLIHKEIADKQFNNTTVGQSLIDALKQHNVTVYGDKQAASKYKLEVANDLHHEYSDLACTVVIVDNIDSAIDHIHTYGSSHTELIVTENKQTSQQFIRQVDSACVFVNTSTRFADGFRFGLGAEVGISTGRLHARGPVGVDGITTTKWICVSTSQDGDTAKQYADGDKKWVHKSLPIEQDKSFTKIQ